MNEPATSGELIGGRYAIRELLGVGGTGSVFAADDTGDPGARVALKLLHPHLCVDDASRDAFLREARHAMALEHPNVVRVHGAGLHDAAGVVMPWIALDLLGGPTLQEWVRMHGPVDPADAGAVIGAVLDGLGSAHRAGIVHRDVSPQNIVLLGGKLAAEAVRIVDFGLADVSGRTTLGSDVLLAAEAGASAGVIGNAAYMSPEQAQGSPVRSVSDLYQTGAVLYFALTGTPPFRRDTTAQVLQAHVHAPPPVPSALVAAARPFDRIVTTALAKTPAHRFRDATAFHTALDEATDAAAAVDAAGAVAQSETKDVDETATRVLPPELRSGTPLGYLAPPATETVPATSSVLPARGGLAAVVAGVAIMGLAVWGVVAATATPNDPSTESSPAPTVSGEPPAATPGATPATVPTLAASAPASAPDVAVPTLHGTLADAEAALWSAGLTLGSVMRVESPDPAERVLAQQPSGGTVPAGGAVNVTVASGSNVVPQVSGVTFAAASALLESAGFLAAGDRADATASSIVERSEPGGGAVMRLGVRITLIVRPTPTPGATAPADPATPDRAGSVTP